MLWLGIHLPHLPLEVFERGLADRNPDGTAACALAIARRATIELANAAAREAGVRPGQKRATALAVAPSLVIRERDPAREQQALTQLANWALQFTPRLSLQSPDAGQAVAGLLLDIEASLGLFGGLDKLLGRIREELQALGYRAAIACAPTPTAAWLFARWRDGLVVRTEHQLSARLADLPVGLLGSLETRRDAVDAIGLKVFRDLAHLPRNGLARRFGAGLLLEMDLALGRQPDIRAWHEAPLAFHSTLELLADVEQVEALLFAVQRQLRELGGWLATRHAAVRHLVLEAHHDRTRRGRQRRGPSLIEARFASPTRDAGRMLGVLRERLAVTGLPAPVHTLHLRCEEITAADPDHRQLFPAAASASESLGRLVERLQARLGHDQVQRVRLCEDHRPEAAYRMQVLDERGAALPALSGAAGARASRDARDAAARAAGIPSAAVSAHLIPRPLWLLPRPIALREHNQRPWWHGPLRLINGPERIEGGWWDCRLVQRDYFIAEDDHAQWLWIYRTRGGHDDGTADGDAAERHATWYLQGIFG